MRTLWVMVLVFGSTVAHAYTSIELRNESGMDLMGAVWGSLGEAWGDAPIPVGATVYVTVPGGAAGAEIDYSLRVWGGAGPTIHKTVLARDGTSVVYAITMGAVGLSVDEVPSTPPPVTGGGWLPTADASTFAGQMQWFMAGFLYASVIGSVALMVRLFKSLSRESPDL